MRIPLLLLPLSELFLKVRCALLMVERGPIGSMCRRRCHRELGHHFFLHSMAAEVAVAGLKVTVATTGWPNPTALLLPTQTERAPGVRMNFNSSGTEVCVVVQQLNVTSMTWSSSDFCSTSCSAHNQSTRTESSPLVIRMAQFSHIDSLVNSVIASQRLGFSQER